jgi:hypothetical protein
MSTFCDGISSWLACISGALGWEDVKAFANSAFLTSLLGSLAGAFAGAAAAQHIAERSKLREEMLREMRNINAAVALAFGICNGFLALKKQHVKALKDAYDTGRADLLEFKRKRKAGEIAPDVPFEFKADLQTLQSQEHPTDILRSIIFERLSTVGRPLNLVVALNQAAEDLKNSMAKRNSLIEGYKSQFSKDTSGLVPLYFGLPYGGGHVNMDYPGAIDSIYRQTDDGIYFAQLLCKDLRAHGLRLAERFKKIHKTEPPRVTEVDFTPAIEQGLMPKDADYDSWTKAFVEMQQ